MRFVPVFCFFALGVLLASDVLLAGDAYPPPRFTDPERVQKLESAFPDLDQIFRHYASMEIVGQHGGEAYRAHESVPTRSGGPAAL
jgi:hypothetical protein